MKKTLSYIILTSMVLSTIGFLPMVADANGGNDNNDHGHSSSSHEDSHDHNDNHDGDHNDDGHGDDGHGNNHGNGDDHDGDNHDNDNNHGHDGHDGDHGHDGDECESDDCDDSDPETPTCTENQHLDLDSNTCVNNPPVIDVCSNIDGNQSVLPEGMVLQSGECVLIAQCSNTQTLNTETNTCVNNPVDLCSNIDGIQTTIPEGLQANDGQCTAPVSVSPTPTPTPSPSPSPSPSPAPENENHMGGGNGPIVGSLGLHNQGQVLGASCENGGEVLITSYMGLGKKNNPDQVKKLQEFLNDYLHTNIPVNGIFDQMTFEKVKEFQLKENLEVLNPWFKAGLMNDDKTPTGYVYKTTTRRINLLKCAELDIPVPQLP